MIFILARRCVKAITGEQVDYQNFAALIGKQFGILTKLEEERFILFKFSDSLQELTQLLGLNGINQNIIEQNHDIIKNNQQKYKIQIQQQSKRIEPIKKNFNPIKNISKSIDVKQVEIPKLQSDLREMNKDNSNIKEIKEVNQNIIRNSFFIQRKSISTENGYYKTLEQKEKEFLDRFKYGQNDH
ncbi:unnamed protein product [Paramecium pentaurelia]|uniref:Uncharacterized protein n=1 Tax=Paramecium pentaurelia TaxID=43138 RepID=A0A8S1VJM1_9CILI|nr:unnamed protein product [Paramecium pentaurelia]